MKEKIKELLGEGLAPGIVANAVGVSPAYVSQLLADETFKQEVIELRIAKLSATTSRDRKYDSIEDTLLSKLEAAVPMLFRPAEILAAIKTINGAQRRGAPADATPVTYKTVVNLNIPEVARAKLLLNESNQIIEIGGRVMATMQANVLLKQLGVEAETETEKLGEQVNGKKSLPSPTTTR